MQRPNLFPRIQDFHWGTAQRLLATGFWFFVVSILLAAGLYSDNLIIAHFSGLDKVPLYSVPATITGYLSAIAGMVYAPLWAANGEALARGDVAWVRRTTSKILKLNALITGFAGVLFVIAGPVLLHLWIGPSFTPGRFLFAGLASWAFLLSVMGPLFMILNGANVVWVQVLIFAPFSLIALLLKIIFVQQFGIGWVVWASVVVYVTIVVPCVILTVKRVLQTAFNDAPSPPPR